MRSLASVLAFSLVVVAALATLFASPSPAHASKKTYEDKKLGFAIKIEDSWVQVPPKLGADTAFMVGEWYEDSPKYDASLRPEFKICWWPEPKGAAITGGSAPQPAPAAPTGAPTEEEMRAAFRDAYTPKSMDDYAPRLLDQEYFFGPTVPMADRWKTSTSRQFTSGKNKVTLEYFEVNAPTKKKLKEKPVAYAVVGRMDLDRPTELIHVGFMGTCAYELSKDMQSEFIKIMISFVDQRTGTDTLNQGASKDLSDDPVKRREQVRKNKVIPGWSCVDTANYILLYSNEVDPKLVRKIGEQIEAIRSQVYELIFPPDRPITAVCIVRVCKDREQYSAYGGPGGSAGYWSSGEEELVFYEDSSAKDDSLRVLYHEAFHQYIFYSVGDFSPHSWFNEGHGDFFAGFNYSRGKWVREKFGWRIGEAKSWKHNPKRAPLKEWLGWTQGQYYGNNKQGVDGGANYALGWSFIWFLRTTKNPAYTPILDTYFKTLKGKVTAARAAKDAYRKAVEDWDAKFAADPENAGERPSMPTSDYDQAQWLSDALDTAFKGVDMDKLEKDWLDD